MGTATVPPPVIKGAAHGKTALCRRAGLLRVRVQQAHVCTGLHACAPPPPDASVKEGERKGEKQGTEL
jgi:hypothetical protein